MPLPVTGFYAALLAIYFVALSFYVSAVRGRTGVGLGDGGSLPMLVAMRRHGNMAEFVPFALILLALGEAASPGAVWLHVSGLLLLGGRLVHPFGISAGGGYFPARVAGQLATYAAMMIPAAVLLAALA